MSGLAHGISVALIALAAAVCVISAFALVFMRPAVVRLHFAGPPATVGAVALTLAAWLDRCSLAAAVKMGLIAVMLFVLNAAVSHATARAAWIRERGWPPPRDLVDATPTRDER